VLAARSATDESTVRKSMKSLFTGGFHTEVLIDSA